MAPGIAEKKNNTLPVWGNEKTMNLNNLILTNILSSHYFKVSLYKLKTYHEVIDEIYYKVNHLEPWEKGSRKTSGQTGMCGGVRGVGAGGIVSTAFCILYKLYTLKLTRKQLVGLITHGDSPFIRALGFMYIRYTQPPEDLWEWFESYLSDEEELDPKAGGGQIMSIGEMLKHYLSKLEWFSTLFPRIPVPIQKDIERKLSDWRASHSSETPVKSSREWDEGTQQQQQQTTTDDWSDSARGGRSYDNEHEDSHSKVEHGKESRDHRHRPHGSSGSRRHSSERHRDRSRSPRRHSSKPKSSRDDRSRRKHRDRSSERHQHYKSHRDSKPLHDSVSEHPKDRNHEGKKSEKRHREHPRKHDSSRQENEYSQNRDRY